MNIKKIEEVVANLSNIIKGVEEATCNLHELQDQVSTLERDLDYLKTDLENSYDELDGFVAAHEDDGEKGERHDHHHHHKHHKPQRYVEVMMPYKDERKHTHKRHHHKKHHHNH